MPHFASSLGLHRPSPSSSTLRCMVAGVALLLGCGGLWAQEGNTPIGPWVGATGPHATRVMVKAADPESALVLRLGRDESLADATPHLPAPRRPGSAIAVFDLDGLDPDTVYHYVVEAGGEPLAPLGRFRTFPAGPASFSFAFAACAVTGSTHPVFDAIRERNPLFYMNVGDFHYQNIGVNDIAVFQNAFDRVLGAPSQAHLYRSTTLVYMWDDHDYGPNNSDREAVGREAARLAYRDYIPHYPLAFPGPDAPIDQAFTVGRVRFILSDLRSERHPNSEPDESVKQMMNDRQLAWFKEQVQEAQRRGQYIFWVSSVPWHQSPGRGRDNWGGFAKQRKVIANFLAESGARVVVLAGDAHMLGADDGTNARYADDPETPGQIVLQAGSLDRNGSLKGGPYSHGAFPSLPGEGQYGWVDVEDTGDALNVRFGGWAVKPDGEAYERLSLSFTLPR